VRTDQFREILNRRIFPLELAAGALTPVLLFFRMAVLPNIITVVLYEQLVYSLTVWYHLLKTQH
jgi:hypothetical protein